MFGERLSERPRSGLAPPAQSGQISVLAVLFLVAMLGFTGLALDAGHAMDRYREAQNSADAAALAGADAIYLSANLTVAAAETQAQNAATEVMQADGLGTETYTLTFLGANKQQSTFTNPDDIDYVRADVRDSVSTFFIQVLGISGTNVGAHAMARMQWRSMCELCVLDPTANGALSVSGSGGFSGVNIRIFDNSNYPGSALNVSGSGAITDTGTDAQIYVAGGANYPAGAVNPAPVTGVQPIPDPLAWVSPPANIPPGSCVTTGGKSPCKGGGTPPSVSVTSSSNAGETINPGVYSGISVGGNQSLYLNPGIYVITGAFNVQSGSTASVASPAPASDPAGAGVMLYLACSTNKAPYYQVCPALQLQTNGTYKSSVSPNQMGSLGFSGGSSMVLWGPNSAQAGLCPATDTIDNDSASDACPSADAYANQPAYVPWQYTGLLVFQDRNDTDTMSLAGSSSVSPVSSCTTLTAGASCVAGTIYGTNAAVQISGGGTQQTALQSYVIADTITFTGSGGTGGGGTFAVSFPPGVNAPLAPLNGLVE
jgi:hypothetical protein